MSQRATVERIRAVTGSSINTMMVSRWERGERSPSVESLGAFLWGLGYSLRDLCEVLEELTLQDDAEHRWNAFWKLLETDTGCREEVAEKLQADFAPETAEDTSAVEAEGTGASTA